MRAAVHLISLSACLHGVNTEGCIMLPAYRPSASVALKACNS